MIKRKYFMSVRKIHGDGRGSYSSNQAIAEHVSWFPDASKVYEESYEYHKKMLKDRPGNDLEVMAFNRIQ